MNRRKLIAATGAASLTAAAAVVAVGANFSLFGLTSGDAKAGHLQPIVRTTATTAAPTTRTEVVYLDAPPTAAPAPTGRPSRDAAEPDASTESGSDVQSEETDPPELPDAAEPTPTPSATAVPTDGHHHEDDDTGEPDDSSETEHPDD